MAKGKNLSIFCTDGEQKARIVDGIKKFDNTSAYADVVERGVNMLNSAGLPKEVTDNEIKKIFNFIKCGLKDNVFSETDAITYQLKFGMLTPSDLNLCIENYLTSANNVRSKDIYLETVDHLRSSIDTCVNVVYEVNGSEVSSRKFNVCLDDFIESYELTAVNPLIDIVGSTVNKDLSISKSVIFNINGFDFISDIEDELTSYVFGNDRLCRTILEGRLKTLDIEYVVSRRANKGIIGKLFKVPDELSTKIYIKLY